MSIEDDILSQALTYARMGFEVLPVHRPILQAGARVCSCGKLHCASPAKHPVGRLVPRGALHAMKDTRQVTVWFAGTRHNIGIATGEVSNLINCCCCCCHCLPATSVACCGCRCCLLASAQVRLLLNYSSSSYSCY